MNTPTLLVLAAGMGTRYGGLKQLEPVGPNGETIMDYSIFDALKAGFGKIVFLLRREIEAPFKHAMEARFENRADVEYVYQDSENSLSEFSFPPARINPWGTTHAILIAADAIREPFGIINADDFYGARSFELLAKHLQSGSTDYAMVGFVLRKTLSDFGAVSRGVCNIGEDGYLKNIAEFKSIVRKESRILNLEAEGHHTVLNGGEIVSMNMWGFTPKVFGQLYESFQTFLKQYRDDLHAECYISSTLNTLIQTEHARVKALRSPEEWFGLTYREDQAYLAQSLLKLIENGTYPRELWS